MTLFLVLLHFVNFIFLQLFSSLPVNWVYIIRGGSRAAATSKMEHFVIVFQNDINDSWCLAYQGVRNDSFSENLACFVFLKHPF